jgi:hypothetical protein
MKIISPKDLDRILKPEGYSYVLVTKLTPRDRIRWFDQDAIVTAVDIRSDTCYIKVIDPLDQQEKEFKYKKTDELVTAPRNHLN